MGITVTKHRQILVTRDDLDAPPPPPDVMAAIALEMQQEINRQVSDALCPKPLKRVKGRVIDRETGLSLPLYH